MRKVLIFSILLFASLAALVHTNAIKPNGAEVRKPHTELSEFSKDPRAQELLKRIIGKAKTRMDTRMMTAEINEYMDLIFNNLQHLLINYGLDPMDLPDIDEGFKFKFLFITYHGELKLRKGILHELTTMHRNGDVILKYDSLFLHAQVPMSFNTLKFNYDYSAKFMNLGPSGSIDGSISKMQIYTDVMIDLKELRLYMQDFNIEKIGRVDVNFKGNILVDWIINMLSDVVTTVLKRVFTNILNDNVEGILEGVIDTINDDLQIIFG